MEGGNVVTCTCERKEIAKNVFIAVTLCEFCTASKGQETPLAEHMREAQLIAEELRAMAIERLKAKGKL